MPVSFACLLGFVQAVTEFLPVSSSGHLVLCQVLFKESFGVLDVPLSFDVLVHAATLLVCVFYLRKDLLVLLSNIASSKVEAAKSRRLLLLLIVGTLPAAVVGLWFKSQIEGLFSSLDAVSGGFLITAVILFAAHLIQRKSISEAGSSATSEQEEKGLSWELPSMTQALLIGCAQALAILPGVSRSGATIGAALLMGLSANTALRFSFLLSIPAVSGAALLMLGELGALSADAYGGYASGFLTALLFGWLALRLLVVVTKRSRLAYFACYTLALGLVLQLV